MTERLSDEVRTAAGSAGMTTKVKYPRGKKVGYYLVRDLDGWINIEVDGMDEAGVLKVISERIAQHEVNKRGEA